VFIDAKSLREKEEPFLRKRKRQGQVAVAPFGAQAKVADATAGA
jgi:hypothetical protein